ncbi:hypothetical protein C1J01_08885 [Nonomuraea aridisoli]|uniref:Phage portal protein n=1 Tax=Nonomuraea aridisoli TaxID=2070368 RepID=A0A2W2F4G5_9ACTN|nr:hypothetical protein C1J01_08885 [Nonomuraea aridisoli]
MLDVQILRKLIRRIQRNQRRLDTLDGYYEGERRLQALGLALPPELEQLATVINWPGMYVDSLEERLDIEGFRLGGSTRTDERLWDWWQANDLDEESGLLHLEKLITGGGFITVGSPDARSDPPVMTVESPRYMTAVTDPRTRRVIASARLYSDDEDGTPATHATLYLENRTVHYRRRDGQWEEDKADDHKLGVSLVVPVANRQRIRNRAGHTEMRDIMGLTDAACRSLTNLQGAQELLSVPQRYVLGASEDDFKDQDGNPIPAWQAYLGRFLTLMNDQAKVGQFPAADLRNFTEVLNWYARAVSAMTGMPAHYLGFTSDQPASADAIRSSEARFVKRAERQIRSLSGPWEAAQRRAMLVKGLDPNDAVRLETVWRDPATPTFAAKADAIVKLVQAGLLPREAAWEQMGWGPEYRRRLRQLSDDDPAVRFLAEEEQDEPVVDDEDAAA